ncbi:A-kinase anchor protein 9 isoform X3 [Acinonyx jubatus]|uniref:A-kinase anchor protein 9 isoform X3 n=1 Tax=Acinonyx jubatus TaxID=32536 RepID=A0A6J2ACK8_ACIJB|nr:A-kinase anchor protein 9 isoform X3 [Acinonyx jubatus]
MEDEERQKKLEAGKAKLAQFRQRKAQSDGQNPSKKQKKKKKTSSSKQDVSAYHALNLEHSRSDEMYINSSQRVGTAVTPESTIIKRDEIFVEPESEISTTADDYSSEEEEFGADDSYSEHGAQYSQTHLEMMENELAGKQHEIEELNRELEEMRATYGTEGLQQLQEFEAAIKQRDGIITQLTANLQQARREKDETMREFLELTEQSQKLQIQFQHLQASETLRNSTHSSTAADLLQAKQQILTHQQQLEEQDHLLEDYQKKKEDFKMQISFLQEKIRTYEMEQDKKVESSIKEIQEKDAIIEELKTKIIEEEKKTLELMDKVTVTDKLLEELQEQVVGKNQEIKTMKLELTHSKQKERQCSEEIKQLMGTVEELQKKNHKDSQFETDILQRMEQETQRKLEQLRAELDEMYGQQIVQMKQELIKQHMSQIDELKIRHKEEMENALRSYPSITVNEDQIKVMNMAINELNIKLQDSNSQKEKLKEELGVISGEKSTLQRQLEDLFEELSFSREQIQRARQTIAEQESKLNEAHKSLSTVEDLKAEIVSASESRKELELKHEAEVTNYKIKLEMLEREKNAVLDRMAESQEAELERLRTQLLFSHEEELSKLKEDLEIEHRINIEKLKDNLGIHYKQQIDGLQSEMSQKIETMQFEKDSLITKQNQLILEISKLKDLQQSLVNSKSEEMTLQINELQKEIEILRQEEKEKGTLEQEVQELQLKTELLEKQMKEKEDDLQEKFTHLEAENSILKDEKKALEDMLKMCTPVNQEERLLFTDSIKSRSQDCNWQKEIEVLTEENEDLKKQCIQLTEEIERQRNTFSFAEKNFEVNYQELQEDYACLLKVKTDLEDSKNKQEAEYKSKLKTLSEELHHLQRINPTVVKMKSSVFDDDKTFIGEPLEIGEVVEKDTTELMEKLEVTKREKLELSEKLSDLSEQLKQKHGEISFLSEEVKSLKQEKEQVLLRCRELEIIINHNRKENVNACDVPLDSLKDGFVTRTSKDSGESVSKINKDFGEESKIMEENKIPLENRTVEKEGKQEQLFLGHLPLVTSGSSLRTTEPSRNDKLQWELSVLKSEKNDLRLQMEAQRICLSLVYSTHVDQVREYMENEKDKALCSLKEELISAQEEKIKELQEIHQQELQNIKTQETGDEVKPLQMLIGKLRRAVSEECFYFTQTFCNVLGEHHIPAIKCGINIEEKESSGVHTSENQEQELQDYRYEVQDFQENMQTLLTKVTEEYNKLLVLQTRLSKIHGQETDDVKLEVAEGGLPKEETEFLSASQMTNLHDIDVSHKSKLSALQDSEKIRRLEGQVQELENFISSLQQQLKETEENHGAEIHCLQERLQAVSESTVQPSFSSDSMVITESDVQKTVYPGSCVNQNIDGTIEFSDEFGVKKETNMVTLLEKQYQERLEEEVAKVIVSMSIAFAQQTELSRISGEKEDTTSSKQAHFYQQEGYLNETKSSQGQTFEEMDMKFKEEFKPLSKELGENGKEVLLSTDGNLDDTLQSEDHELTISEEMFSKDKTFIVRESIHDEILVSSMDASRQLMLNEEQLEDMRQELVRQYQEHQQATELLRQAHMRQMERQREDQEQLQEEIKRLNRQLAQRSSIDNENLVSERERVLLEELEALKQLSLAGREKLCCELRNSSTQTQNGNENQEEVEEQAFKEKELDRKPEDVLPDILTNESLHGGIWPLRFWLPHWIISMEHSQYGTQTRKTVFALQKANNRLLKILLEVVKTTAAVEETIGRHVLGILDRSSKVQSSASLIWRSEGEAPIKSCIHEEHTGVTDESIPSYSGGDVPRNDSSIWSKVTEEGTDLSEQLMRSGFAGTEIDPENEELMLSISGRLQAAVEKLLEAISETSSQLEHAKVTQTELMRESFRQKQEVTESLKCQEELRERLHEESRAREQLAVELSKAEGVIDGYADEKTLYERQIQEKTDIIDRLEQELLCAGNRLQELEAEQQQIQEERELLSRQKEAMKAEAGPVEQRLVDAAVDAAPGAELLQETEKLMKEKLEVQCQAEKVRDDLQKQVKALEIDVEEQVSRFIELEQEKNAELMDLRQQNQALEKQLEKTRKFLDEQAIDREHERDVFQQEIQKLEQQLKVVPRFQPINEHQTREVEQLTNHLKEKTDKCSELLLSKEQLQRDVQERNEEIEKLEFRVRELEQALLVSTDTFQKVEDQKQSGALEAKTELSLEVQLQAERDAIDRKEKEITNLEEQLEQFREELENKNEEVQQLHMQLEIQKKESTTRLQELEQENKLFKDEMEKLGFAMKESDAISTQDQHVLLGKLAQIMQEKEIEIEQLNEQITKLQHQLKITTDNKVIEEKNELIRDLETQIECLMSDQERVKKNREEEIEQLNEVIEKLQQELALIEQKTSVDATSFPEEADSLKHQLDMVIAEKLALEQQVETTNEEMAFTKNVLEETNLKMNQLTQELCSLKRERENMEEIQSVPEKSINMAIDDLSKTKPELEVVLPENALKPLENQTYFTSFEENSKGSISSLESKVLQLEGTVSAKDLELTQCYKQIKDMQEQGQSETEMLKRKIVNLQNVLEEKVAAALVSQVQLEAVKEYAKFCQDKQPVSSELERTHAQNLNQVTDNEMESNVLALTLRISELESQVVEMQTSLILEKKQVEIIEKNALEKEKRLLELQKLLEEEKKQGGKERKRSPEGNFEVLKTTTELIHTSEESGFFGQLEALRAESSATKEELANYKEKAEKLQEELLIKETSMASLQKDLSQVRNQLIEAEEKLSYFLEKEDKTELQENRKVCILEALPNKVGKSLASQTEGTLKVNSSSQTPQILVRNAGIQVDLQSECSSEEVTEIINQFTEKIEQMQELHAAEILDMESRHISETETLKREHYVAVQLLTEECGTLKAVIQCLKSKEGSSLPELTHSDAYQTREICSSDSGSDWGQGIYLTQSQGFDTASEDRGDEGESSTDSFPKKIKGLLRAVHNEGMQVLSLTESPYSDGEDHSVQQVSESWLEERRAYLSTVSALKDLITKIQVQRDAEVYNGSQSHESCPDWRGELLLALQQVFLKERGVLLAAFQTELTALGTRDAVGLLNCLEQRIQEQNVEYQAAMECLQKADRRSLLSEIQALHAQLNGLKMTLKREQESDQPSQELLEYNMQQKQSQMLEMQVELSSMKDRATDLQEQLSSEKMVVAELKSELAQTKLELETTLKAQHKHLKELEAFRLEVKDKTDEVHLLNDTLASEHKKSRELQWALEKEKAKLGRNEERDKEELEDLKFSLEGQKQRNIQLNLLLEQQKQLLNESQEKIESQRVLHDAQLSEERGRNLELQVLLESEKVRIREMSNTLDRERELHAQLQSGGDGGQPGPSLPSEDLLRELQKQLEEKHSRIVELLNETEKYKLDSLQTRQQMEKDRQVHRKTLQTEQEANTEGQKKMHELQSKVEDLQRQLEEKRQQVYKLDLEGKRLQGIMQEFQKQELEREEKRESRRILYQNLNEPTTWSLTSDRTRNWVLQQKIEGETKESGYPKLIEMNEGGAGCNHELEMIRQKLQRVASKLHHLAQKASNRLQFETADDEDFIWVQENIDGIILQLQKLTGQPGQEPSLVSPGTSCGSLTERLLRQNAELTGHISQLTEEKNDLRNTVMKLEEQIRWYRQTGAGRDYSSRFSLSGSANIEAIIASEKEVWNREKLTLQKSLKRAEAEVYKLKAELRNEALLQNLSSDSEHATIKRIYGKYLRAESFRKALIYQKKYLLLLLGGFQECEDATLALLARMGGQPAFTDLEVITHRPKGFTRFRSAVRVSMAISRMKFLVRRWQRVTSSGSININRDGFGLNPGAEKTDPFYQSPGGLELYGEPRHMAYRSRSELDYPRSPLHFQNRYPGPPADLNPGSLACSQLQNYDPDRALTDYITRLEALQRRLGTVQSGSTQFHAGMRR